MFTHRPWFSALVLVAGFAAGACSFLVPGGVATCDNTDDCDDPYDNRFVAACVYGEGQAENSSKVCVADFDDNVSCDPLDSEGTPFAVVFDAALESTAYVGCTDENQGKQGCAAGTGCVEPLTPNDLGLCDDDDPATPKAFAPSTLPEGIEPAGQDVLDQFCRWRMAGDGGEDWICDTTLSSGAQCRQCDDEKNLGEGGCGTLYLQGEPSSVYAPDRNDGSQDDDDAVFGPVPQ